MYVIEIPYLFSGRLLEKDGELVRRNGAPVPIAKSFEPVRNLVVYAHDPRARDPQKKRQYYAWQTDPHGRLVPLDPSFKTEAKNRKPVNQARFDTRFLLMPPEAIALSWAVHGKDFAGHYSDFLASSAATREGALLPCLTFDAKQVLRDPIKDSTDPEEIEYRDWYQSRPAGLRITAFVLVKVRTLLLVYSENLPKMTEAVISAEHAKEKLERTVTIQQLTGSDSDPDSEKGSAKDLSFAAFFGDERQLPSGMYTIKTTIPKIEGSNQWSADVLERKSYSLREMVRFDIETPVGELAVVACDPISVEEALIQQFPIRYAPLVDRAHKYASVDDEGDADLSGVGNALKPWTSRVRLARSEAKLSLKLVNAEGRGKRSAFLARILFKAMESSSSELVVVSAEALNLAFMLKDASADFRGYRAKLLGGQQISHVQEITAETVRGYFKKNRWFAFLDEKFLKDRGAEIFQVTEKGEGELLKLLRENPKGPPDESKLAKWIGPGAAGRLRNLLQLGDLAANAYVAAAAWVSLDWTRKALEDNQQLFAELLAEYDKEENCRHAPSRKALQVLERFRALTVANQLEVSQATWEAILTTLDSITNSLCIVPISGIPAGTFVLVKQAGKYLFRLYEYLDQEVIHFTDTESSHLQDALAALTGEALANRQLMPTEQVDPDHLDQPRPLDDTEQLEVQLRLRAEALSGLEGLLTRAALSEECRERGVFSKQKYLQKVRDYHIEDFIRLYLLRDGWQIPLDLEERVSMDQYWLYALSSHGATGDVRTYMEAHGFSEAGPIQPRDLVVSEDPQYGLHMMSVIKDPPANDAVAAFQQAFPFQRREAASIEDLATAFIVDHPWIDKDCILFSCVYSWQGTSKTWHPLDPDACDYVEGIGTMGFRTRLRVLIVLDPRQAKPGEGAYPISLQVCRVDNGTKGPVYKESARLLDPFLLKGEEKWKGQVGCVFEPFFLLGTRMFFGVKPLAEDIEDFRGSTMTYGFKVKVGGWKYFEPLKLGAAHHDPEKYAKANLATFRVKAAIHQKMKGDEIFAQEAFLKERATRTEYGQLFNGKSGLGACLIRDGLGFNRYRWAVEGSKRTINDTFEWNRAVEFGLILWGHDLNKKAYEELGLSWRRIPVSFDLVQDGFTGPRYNSELVHLGELCVQVDQWKSFETAEVASSPLKEIMDLLGKSSDLRRQIVRRINREGDRVSLFAAHFPMSYTTVTGQEVKSIRPFGEDDQNPIKGVEKYYKYRLGNIQLPAGTGVGPLEVDYEFWLAAPPRFFDPDAPWTKGLSIPSFVQEDAVKSSQVGQSLQRWYALKPTADLLSEQPGRR